MPTLSFELTGHGPIQVAIDQLVIAGWAGRDQAAVEAHIAELAELGVPRPSQVPCFYRLAASLLSSDQRLQTPGRNSSGEAEVVLIQAPEGLLLGIGSDHTDRKVESYDVTVSKQLCAKPIGLELWRFEEVAPHWERLQLKCWRSRDGADELYQDGEVASLLDPRDLIQRLTGGERLPIGWAMFCGTQPVIGELGHGDAFEVALIDPVLGRELRHRYRVEALEVAS
ncbi:DUF2848 domain-containing protein [Halotalea alkalilenta]|uniref:DUF2848 domain-containing protein n=1 Tax=Halotalea alkalilenta TaxID=376489 RepID=A0A172YBT7_9GAMM|nr:DUF2848 domain-containing protein [Halotalea alkalilenta]ANF56465.1 hypothetical protein A5892_02435 [Halotalea alkalilenta]